MHHCNCMRNQAHSLIHSSASSLCFALCQANAAYIHLADEFVQVPGGSNNNNYANIRLITDIAERTGAHAVWPGWGHASENDRLPEVSNTA